MLLGFILMDIFYGDIKSVDRHETQNIRMGCSVLISSPCWARCRPLKRNLSGSGDMGLLIGLASGRPIPPAAGGIAVISVSSRDAPRPLPQLPEFLRPLLRLLGRSSSAEVGSWRAPGPTLRRSHGGDLRNDWWGGCV
ncbi:hypothetical protein GOODEAATRI_034599 [Goodea atripinnis]|uniref:Uncharacterized protein n=1 Tax=Goodea atripinnis TaxID=208336 RepID=A0ABV0MN25_9TELE